MRSASNVRMKSEKLLERQPPNVRSTADKSWLQGRNELHFRLSKRCQCLEGTTQHRVNTQGQERVMSETGQKKSFMRLGVDRASWATGTSTKGCFEVAFLAFGKGSSTCSAQERNFELISVNWFWLLLCAGFFWIESLLCAVRSAHTGSIMHRRRRKPGTTFRKEFGEEFDKKLKEVDGKWEWKCRTNRMKISSSYFTDGICKIYQPYSVFCMVYWQHHSENYHDFRVQDLSESIKHVFW